MTERAAGHWLAGFKLFTQESPAPDDYLFWTGLHTLAGALQRKVYYRWNYDPIYTNMYVILVGPAGNYKSQTLNFERTLLRAIQANIASEAMTKEGLIAQMVSRAVDQVSAATVISSDLMSFFRPSQGSMIEFLTDIFDCPVEWEYTTRNRAPDIIKKAYLNFAAGTTPAWIAENFNSTFTDQGFASRTLFIYADQPRFRKARSHITPEMWEMRDLLVEDLLRISELEGEFEITNDGWEVFEQWFEHDSLREQFDYRLDGYKSRKALHFWKVAQLLSVAEKDELVITKDNVEMALAVLKNMEPQMARAFAAVGKNPIAVDHERIYQDIVTAGSMTKAEILNRNLHAVNKSQLDEILTNLLLMGKLHAEVRGSEVTYTPRSVN